jgi:septum site-determining protein MinD
MHMGVTVSVISGKGGTGKTTLCAGIAACLAAEGKRVILIDGDLRKQSLKPLFGISASCASMPTSA